MLHFQHICTFASIDYYIAFSKTNKIWCWGRHFSRWQRNDCHMTRRHHFAPCCTWRCTRWHNVACWKPESEARRRSERQRRQTVFLLTRLQLEIDDRLLTTALTSMWAAVLFSTPCKHTRTCVCARASTLTHTQTTNVIFAYTRMLLLPPTHNPLQTAAPLVPSWEFTGILLAALVPYDSMQLPWLKMHQPRFMTTTHLREMLATTANALRCYFSCVIVPASVLNHWRLSFSSPLHLCKLPLSFVTYIHLVPGLEKLCDFPQRRQLLSVNISQVILHKLLRWSNHESPWRFDICWKARSIFSFDYGKIKTELRSNCCLKSVEVKRAKGEIIVWSKR